MSDKSLGKLAPQKSIGWIHRSYALHELKRTQEAYENLLPVADKFPDEWRIPFQLACYQCQLGERKEALGWLERAIDVAGKVDIRLKALDDPDLEPLWKEFGRK